MKLNYFKSLGKSLVLSAGLVTGCTTEFPPLDCDNDSNCNPGQVCVDNACADENDAITQVMDANIEFDLSVLDQGVLDSAVQQDGAVDNGVVNDQFAVGDMAVISDMGGVDMNSPGDMSFVDDMNTPGDMSFDASVDMQVDFELHDMEVVDALPPDLALPIDASVVRCVNDEIMDCLAALNDGSDPRGRLRPDSCPDDWVIGSMTFNLGELVPTPEDPDRILVDRTHASGSFSVTLPAVEDCGERVLNIENPFKISPGQAGGVFLTLALPDGLNEMVVGFGTDSHYLLPLTHQSFPDFWGETCESVGITINAAGNPINICNRVDQVNEYGPVPDTVRISRLN